MKRMIVKKRRGKRDKNRILECYRIEKKRCRIYGEDSKMRYGEFSRDMDSKEIMGYEEGEDIIGKYNGQKGDIKRKGQLTPFLSISSHNFLMTTGVKGVWKKNIGRNGREETEKLMIREVKL